MRLGRYFYLVIGGVLFSISCAVLQSSTVGAVGLSWLLPMFRLFAWFDTVALQKAGSTFVATMLPPVVGPAVNVFIVFPSYYMLVPRVLCYLGVRKVAVFTVTIHVVGVLGGLCLLRTIARGGDWAVLPVVLVVYLAFLCFDLFAWPPCASKAAPRGQ